MMQYKILLSLLLIHSIKIHGMHSLPETDHAILNNGLVYDQKINGTRYYWFLFDHHKNKDTLQASSSVPENKDTLQASSSVPVSIANTIGNFAVNYQNSLVCRYGYLPEKYKSVYECKSAIAEMRENLCSQLGARSQKLFLYTIGFDGFRRHYRTALNDYLPDHIKGFMEDFCDQKFGRQEFDHELMQQMSKKSNRSVINGKIKPNFSSSPQKLSEKTIEELYGNLSSEEIKKHLYYLDHLAIMPFEKKFEVEVYDENMRHTSYFPSPYLPFSLIMYLWASIKKIGLRLIWWPLS